MEVEQIITWYEQNLSSLVNNYKEDLKIGLDLLPEQLQESVMNHRLQSNKDNHPNGLAHISLSDYSNLYQKYYSFKALYKEVQLRFEFSNDEIQLAETFPLWNKIKQIIEKKSKSKIVALPLRYKLLKSWLGFL